MITQNGSDAMNKDVRPEEHDHVKRGCAVSEELRDSGWRAPSRTEIAGYQWIQIAGMPNRYNQII